MAHSLLGRGPLEVMQHNTSISLISTRQQPTSVSCKGRRLPFSTTAQNATLAAVTSHSPRHNALYCHSRTTDTYSGHIQQSAGMSPRWSTSSRRLPTIRCQALQPTASSTRGLPEQQQAPEATAPAVAHGSSQQAHSGGKFVPQEQQQQKQWELVSRTGLAGGVLEVVRWEGDRNIRVWLPPGYSTIDAVGQPYPVLYLNDGQNLFGDCPTMSGASWQAAEAAAGLITSGKVPPFIIVGIDHAGVRRSLEYTPCKPGTGPGGFRSDAADWPGGGITAYLQRLHSDVIPWVQFHYPVSCDPADMAFGGSSFGGVAALVAGMQGEGCGFGALLVESPSMWIGEGAFLEEVQAYRGSWPSRVYLGMGGREYSGARGGKGQEHDAHFPKYLQTLYSSLTQHGGLGPDRLAWTLDQEADHTESAWAARLPAALQFIAGGWWNRWLEHNGGGLYFTVPRRLKAGASGQGLFFNRNRSHTLSQLPPGVGLKLVMGVNSWQNTTQLTMVPADKVQQLQLQPPQKLLGAAMQDWQQQWQQQVGQQGTATSSPPAAAAVSAAGTPLSSGSGISISSGGVPGLDPVLQSVLQRPAASCGVGDWANGDWWVVQLPQLPADCYQVDAVFCDEYGTVYDNNDSNDYYIPAPQPDPWQPVQPPPPVEQQQQQQEGRISLPGRGSGTVAAAAAAAAVVWSSEQLQFEDAGRANAILAAAAAAVAPAEAAAAAAASSSQVCFSMPAFPVAGAPMKVYVNRARLAHGLGQAPNLKLYIGFDGWEGTQQLDLKPTSLWRDETTDWWSVGLQVPSDAVLTNFAFTAQWNGDQAWDNNWGHDYQLPVRSPAAAAAAAAAEASLTASVGTNPHSSSSSNGGVYLPMSAVVTPPPPGFSVREVESSECTDLAGGVLEVLTLKKRTSGGGDSSNGNSGSNGKARWWDERRIRLWMPPGFKQDKVPPGGFPALVMCDGQNMFEDWLAHQGVSWHLAHAAAGLMSVAAIPPCLCIAIDSAGPLRSYNYLPFPPGTGEGGFRGDAARWPGGGAHDFLMRVEHEIMPLLQERYGISKLPSRLAFGGGSFAGVTAIMAATLLPHVFGGILVESPSLWVGEGRYLQDLAQYSGRLPERLSLGCGTAEYSATRDHDRPDVDALLLHQYHECAHILQAKGLKGPQRLKFLVEEGAGHHEGAWRWRLSGALTFLASGWYNS